LLVHSSEAGEAERTLQRADRLFVKLAAEHPDRPSIRGQHALTLANLATLYRELGEHGVAVSFWRDALALADEAHRPAWQVELAAALARTGDHARAAAMLSTDPAELKGAVAPVRLARAWALCAAAVNEDKDLAEARRAELVRHFAEEAAAAAKAAGATPEEIESTDDFVILRQFPELWKPAP
jgi:hypothetical protein